MNVLKTYGMAGTPALTRRVRSAAWLAALLLTAATTVVRADTWELRPGLWEVTMGSDSPQLKQGMMVPAFSAPHMLCLDKPSTALKDTFEAFGKISREKCSHRLISRSEKEQIVEDRCELHPPTSPDVSVPEIVTRHVETLEGIEALEMAELKLGPIGMGVHMQYRWISADCGSVAPRSTSK